MSKREYKKNRDRVYDVMGIPKKERGTVYDVHHIVTRSDVKENPELWADFNVNEASNLFPIPRKDHERLHRKIDQMGKRH